MSGTRAVGPISISRKIHGRRLCGLQMIKALLYDCCVENGMEDHNHL